MKSAAAAFCLVVLSGCSGFGVTAQSDPAAKLQQAHDLLDVQGRPLPAERLIREAIEIYRQNGDEIGLADGYRAYGLFFRAGAVAGRWSNYYRKSGFLDSSASFDTRYEKSLEYLHRAGEIYSRHARFDALTNVNLNAGFSHVMVGQFRAGCQAFDLSAENMRDNLRQNPAAKPVMPAGYDSYEKFVVDVKKRYGCAYL